MASTEAQQSVAQMFADLDRAIAADRDRTAPWFVGPTYSAHRACALVEGLGGDWFAHVEDGEFKDLHFNDSCTLCGDDGPRASEAVEAEAAALDA